MYRIGEAELKRIEGLFKSGNIFRYGMGAVSYTHLTLPTIYSV